MKIDSIFAREILDSRGNPTVEAEVKLKGEKGKGFGRASAPSGASTGIHEAFELRDGEKRFLGKGVLKTVENVNTIISKELEKINGIDGEIIDRKMIEVDKTENKKRLGANGIVAVSMALRKAIADYKEIPLYEQISQEYGGKGIRLPTPMLNIINGGKHAGGELAIQEFMIVPQMKTFRDNLRISSEIYHLLAKHLVKKYGKNAKNIGDEGGYAPLINSAEEAFEAILHSIEEAGYLGKVKLAIDAAASSFYKNGKYALGKEKELDSGELIEYYSELVKKYPLISIEDPFEEDDFESFAGLNEKIGDKIQIVGDDLLVTNIKRIEKALEKNACNALLLKVNQIGTVYESELAAQLCKKNKWNIVVSHRSGETEDNFIADFAVGIGSEYIKTGAPARGERTAKYNQLLRIEQGLNK